MIKIVTDSTAYLPEEIVQRYGIHVIPLNVLFGNRIYKEGLDLSYEQFYQKLAQAKNLPTTSQPAVGEFYDLYSELTRDGSEVISIHISSKIRHGCSSWWTRWNTCRKAGASAGQPRWSAHCST